MSLWPSNSAQTISFGGYTKLAHKTQVTGFFSYGLWSNDEPLQPFTINSALPPIALPRANTDGEAHVFSTNLNLTSHPSTDWRFSARFRNYTYANHMPATRITHIRQLRLGRVDDAHRRSRSLRAQPDHVRRRRDVDEAEAARADGRLHAQRQRLRRADLRVERRERVPRVGRRGRILVGHLPRAIRGRRAAPDRASTRTQLTDDRRAAGDAPLRPRRPDEKPLHRPGRHRAVGRLDVQRVRRRPARTTSATASSACRSRPAAPSRSPPTTTGRTASARAPPTTTSGTPDCSRSHEGDSSDGAVQRSAARLDGRLDRDGALLLDLRDAAPHRPQHRGAVLVRLQPRGGQLPLHDPGGQPDHRRPISCRTCSTSCSSCTSTCATG